MYMENILDALAIYGYSNLEDRIEFELDGVIEKEIAPESGASGRGDGLRDQQDVSLFNATSTDPDKRG